MHTVTKIGGMGAGPPSTEGTGSRKKILNYTVLYLVLFQRFYNSMETLGLLSEVR